MLFCGGEQCTVHGSTILKQLICNTHVFLDLFFLYGTIFQMLLNLTSFVDCDCFIFCFDHNHVMDDVVSHS